MALVVFLQEDEGVPSVYCNVKIFVKRPPGQQENLLFILYFDLKMWGIRFGNVGYKTWKCGV